MDSADPLGPCSAITLRLAKAHLARSALTLDDARRAGITAVDDAREIDPGFASHAALVYFYRRPDGSIVSYERNGVHVPFARVRYLPGAFGALPKGGRRYDNPEGAGTQIHFPCNCDWTPFDRREETRVCVAVVEGEAKASAMCAAGIPTIAIGGVWNTRDSGTKSIHPDLAAFAAKCSDVYIVFDSDVETNERVAQAELRLASHLGLLGKRVHPVRLPRCASLGADGKPIKVGADDFIVAHGGLHSGGQALSKLILSTPALGERMARSDDDAISVADLLAREVQPVEELIPGLVEKGIPTFLCGPGGVHKSRLALQWGLALNAGAGPWGSQHTEVATKIGAPVPQGATLVYCSAEDDANELARRVQAISRELGIPHVDCGVFVARKGKDSALVIMHESGECTLTPFYFEVIARLRNVPGHKVVVLDSAYDFVRFMGRAKIDEDSVNLFIKVVLQGICDQTESTLIVPWHPSQAGSGREEMDGWSVAWRNAARARLALSVVKDKEDEYELRVEKRNHAAKGQPVVLRFHQGALLPRESVPQAANSEALRRAVVDTAIKAAEMGLPFTQQRRTPPWALEAAERAAGRSVKEREFKDALQQAALVEALRYVKGDHRRSAGFYPGDETWADELARRAKGGAGKPAEPAQ